MILFAVLVEILYFASLKTIFWLRNVPGMVNVFPELLALTACSDTFCEFMCCL